jgi:hypothetical protein
MLDQTISSVDPFRRVARSQSTNSVANIADISMLVQSEMIITSQAWGEVALSKLLTQSHTPSTMERVGYFPRFKPSADEHARVEQIKKNQGAIALLQQFLADSGDYDCAVWEEVKSKIEENRLSDRKRFSDTTSDS